MYPNLRHVNQANERVALPEVLLLIKVIIYKEEHRLVVTYTLVSDKKQSPEYLKSRGIFILK